MFSPKVIATEHERSLRELHSIIDEMQTEISATRRAQAEPSEWLERVLTKKVIVHTKGDQSIEGLLVANYADGLLLHAPSLLNSGAAPTPMAGEVFIPRPNVLLVQLDR